MGSYYGQIFIHFLYHKQPQVHLEKNAKTYIPITILKAMNYYMKFMLYIELGLKETFHVIVHCFVLFTSNGKRRNDCDTGLC